jgi:hypothetical protein
VKKPILLLTVAVGALVLAGCGGTAAETGSATNTSSSTASQSSPSSASESPDAATGASSFKDGVLTTPNMKIEITKHKIIPVGKKGNEYGSKPVIAFWYKTTNLGDEKVNPTDLIMVMSAFQDTNPNAENQLEVGSLPDDKFLDTQLENIKKGGTVESAIAYELDDLKTPVVLVASDDLGASEIGRVTYDLK